MKLRIYGNVKDTKGSQPIIGANVKLFLNEEEIQQVDSIKNGFFELVAEFDDSRLEGGQQLIITVEKEGYQTQKHRVFTTEDSFNLDVSLEPVAAPEPKKPFNWLPVAIGGGVVCVLLVVSAITWGVISNNNTNNKTYEADPTVLDSVKDGVDWTEISGIPAGFADGVDDMGGDNGHSLNASDGDPVDAVYVDDAGNVGIGTTSPKARLDVSGELLVGGSAADKDVLVVLASAKVFPESDGLTNSWSAKGAYWACPMIYRSRRFPDAGGGTFPCNNYGELILQGTSHGNIYNRGISFVTSPNDSTSPSIKMRINPDGNVGIGTTNPQNKLHVVGGDVGVNGELKFTDSSTSIYGRIGNNGSNLQFGTGSSGWNMTILAATGNVGIGTTSPQARLDVSGELLVGGSAADKDVLVVLASSKVFPESDGLKNNWSAKGAYWACPMIYRSRRSPDKGGGTFPDNNYGELILQGTSHGNGYNRGISFVTSPNDSTSPSIKMRINPNGNVGIGTTVPKGTLDVNGSIYHRGLHLHADYVFEPDYKLESIVEHAEFMWDNKHLKAIPKVKVDESGQEIIEIGAHRKGIVEELEKAHIYIEQLYKQNKKLEEQNEALEERLTKLEAILRIVQ